MNLKLMTTENLSRFFRHYFLKLYIQFERDRRKQRRPWKFERNAVNAETHRTDLFLIKIYS